MLLTRNVKRGANNEFMLRLNRFVQFQVGNEIIKDMNPMEAYKIGLTTWSQWIDANIDPSNTTVLFQGITASHSG